jgi:O-succinylbenzoate synthase
MKIWLHRYELRPNDQRMPSRQGALIKIEWVAGQIGYSDLHPWPEFGDAPLESHLDSLSRLEFSPLVETSLDYNYLDREFRLLKRNAFLGLILPRTHYLVFDVEALSVERLSQLQAQGFSHIKVKFGRNLKTETAILLQLIFATPLMWRLDFNGRIAAEEFYNWWKDLDVTVKSRIDCVEDPIPQGEMQGVGPWAQDWKNISRAPIRIVKPARENMDAVMSFERIIFTHSLEHALGRACSLWSAAKFYGQHPKRMEVCGLGTPDIYHPSEFDQAWDCPGPRMKPTTGLGFGFDSLLAGLKWQSIL